MRGQLIDGAGCVADGALVGHLAAVLGVVADHLAVQRDPDAVLGDAVDDFDTPVRLAGLVEAVILGPVGSCNWREQFRAVIMLVGRG